jgi:hypothetical protein
MNFYTIGSPGESQEYCLLIWCPISKIFRFISSGSPASVKTMFGIKFVSQEIPIEKQERTWAPTEHEVDGTGKFQ